MSESHVYQLADNSARFFALIIDSIIVGAIGGIFGVSNAWFLGGLLSFVIGAGYQWFFLTRNNGQTPGKMLLKIRVIKSDGTEITEIDAVMRYLGYIINSPVLMLGWLWAFWDPNQQGWHDKLARTYVVRADESDQRGTVVLNKRKVDQVE
jgi:uncharacterized RDD family membrane protein YckC